MSKIWRIRLGLVAGVLGVLLAGAPPCAASLASDILEATGVRGGLIVHAHCGTGELTAALRVNDRYMVHGLDTNQENVDAARARILARGEYGPITIDTWDGKQLPYIDNFVNLLVSEVPLGVPRTELLRVLTPNGCAYVKDGGVWKKMVKPRPAEMDDWTHYLYDATNNAVSHDTVVAPPRHIQWIGGPRYSRHHDHMSGASAMVSDGGRLFYIFDHATPMSIQMDSDWQLVARDAFNGAILWRREISEWHTQMYRLKSGPVQITRRLVANGDQIYATLGFDAPVSVLDAATGKTIRVIRGTRKTEEILYDDGVLFLLINENPLEQPKMPDELVYEYKEGPRRIAAYDASSGEKLWEHASPNALPLTLTAGPGQVLFNDGDRIVSLDRSNGELLWKSDKVLRRDVLPSFFAPTLVLYEDVVLFSGGSETADPKNATGGDNTMFALSAKNGEVLWTADHPASGYKSPEDILVMKGLVWTPETSFGNLSGVSIGRDPYTGEVKKEFEPDIDTHWFHHRCYRAKGTDNYLLMSRTGIEFVDPDTEHWETHHWVRGACLYGVMPANGIIYNPPHPCACYLEAKMYGFNALAPASPTRAVPREVPEEGRLEKGPAYGKRIAAASQSGDWPTFRGDMARSGSNKSPVSTSLGRQWKTPLGGRLSTVTVAEGKLFVASIDTHTVHALDADTGAPVWQFTTGGRVDSPPTIWQGRALFGSADGYVYCLEAATGELAWRFRAAPRDLRMMFFEQVESVWPVHGSVLIRDGELWTVAGRSMFTDGGIRLLRLDPASGALIAEKIIDDRVPGSEENLQTIMQGLNMPVALTDILSYDGDFVYMRSQRFDAEGERLELEVPTLDVRVRGEGPHLFSPTGFLDDIWWHRSYWIFGRTWKSGAGGYHQAGRINPAGRPMVFDDDTVYGYGRLPEYYRWTTTMEYQLFAAAKLPDYVPTIKEAEQNPRQQRRSSGARGRPAGHIDFEWTSETPVLVRAMVLAGDTLFMAGPPDILDEEEALKAFDKRASQRKIDKQRAALEGARGALLWAVSTSGERLAEWKLRELPVFDGMAAANGRLYFATTDGAVICMGEDERVAVRQK